MTAHDYQNINSTIFKMFFPLICILFLTNFVENNDLSKESIDSILESNRNDSKLLIILVDGFRWDYVSQHKGLKGFHRIAENGVHAEYVKPIFPANSYPNWYAISTGLHAESHGMIDNYMYDQDRKEFFRMSPNQNGSHIHWWNQTEPLWTNAEKQGVKTSMYLWDGCQVNISGIQTSLCHKYRGIYDPIAADNQTRSYVNTILDDFSQNKYRLSMLYYELVDHWGHEYGPSSDNLTKAVQQIDAILNDLYNEIIERKLDKTVNVVIVSDHGMTEMKRFKTISLIESMVDFNNIELMLIWGSGSQIIPKPDKEDEVFNQFSSIEGIKAYKKSEIPQQFHYKNNRRVLPILLTAEFGYVIEPILDGRVRPIPDNEPLSGGAHGYDRELRDMHGIMYGFGPAFKKNFTSEPIEMVDHYNLFCHLLEITPHSNNGTFARVKSFLLNY